MTNKTNNRKEAQKKHLLELLAQTAVNLNKLNFTVNLNEVRTQLHQSLSEIKMAFDGLAKDNLLVITNRHRIDKDILYSCELRLR